MEITMIEVEQIDGMTFYSPVATEAAECHDEAEGMFAGMWGES